MIDSKKTSFLWDYCNENTDNWVVVQLIVTFVSDVSILLVVMFVTDVLANVSQFFLCHILIKLQI